MRKYIFIWYLLTNSLLYINLLLLLIISAATSLFFIKTPHIDFCFQCEANFFVAFVKHFTIFLIMTFSGFYFTLLGDGQGGLLNVAPNPLSLTEETFYLQILQEVLKPVPYLQSCRNRQGILYRPLCLFNLVFKTALIVILGIIQKPCPLLPCNFL